MLDIRPKTKAAWNLLSLDEILLRFDPENERIHNAHSLRVFDGEK